jgi:hypothetical protein
MRHGLGGCGKYLRCAAGWLLAAKGLPPVGLPPRTARRDPHRHCRYLVTASQQRRWEFRGVFVTSCNGTHGTICGPWPPEKHLAASVITVWMIPSGPSGGCRNFNVLVKRAS